MQKSADSDVGKRWKLSGKQVLLKIREWLRLINVYIFKKFIGYYPCQEYIPHQQWHW